MNTASLNFLSSASLVALIALCVAWEMWLAPIRPGGSWLVLKALPLLAPLFGILKGRRYTHQWASLLALAYLVEGMVRATTESGTPRLLAMIELLFATVFFVAVLLYSRATAPSRNPLTPAD